MSRRERLMCDVECVCRYSAPGGTTLAHVANNERNRYKDVFCLDQTRVVLEGSEGDYINANWVKGEPFVNNFICTQVTLPLWKEYCNPFLPGPSREHNRRLLAYVFPGEVDLGG